MGRLPGPHGLTQRHSGGQPEDPPARGLPRRLANPAPEKYPRWQGSEASKWINVDTLDADGRPRPNTTVYFRFVNVPDTSAYRHGKGNLGDPPVLERATRVGDGNVHEATSDNYGQIQLLLRSSRYSGERYQIEGSPTADFSLCPENCSKSGVLTTWKRVYYEYQQMARNSVCILRDAAVGDPFLETEATNLKANTWVTLVHGPFLDSTGPAAIDDPGKVDRTFWTEQVQVTVEPIRNDRTRVRLRLSENTPLRNPYNVDRSFNNTLEHSPTVCDAVLIGSESYQVGTNLLSIFRAAFVELVPIGSWLGQRVPYVAQLGYGNPDKSLRESPFWQFALKWGEHRDRVTNDLSLNQPNFLQLIAAASAMDTPSRGIQQDRDGRQFAYVWRERVANNEIAAKVVPHEFAHAFDVNEDVSLVSTAPHCPDGTKRFDGTGTCLGVTTGDGTKGTVVGWHYFNDQNSEYMQIRKQEDPLRYLP